jgi:uncharacterized protein YyaL (SSP411 family)
VSEPARERRRVFTQRRFIAAGAGAAGVAAAAVYAPLAAGCSFERLVCRRFACKAPVTDPEELERLLA